MSTAKAQGNYIKHQLLSQHNLTLKDFSAKYNFRYDAVSDVVRGIRRGNYGKGREIVEKLTSLIGPLSTEKDVA